MVFTTENDFASFTFSSPILIITVKKNSPTPEEWTWTKETMITYYQSLEISKTRISLIFDLKHLGLLDLGIYRDWANLFIEYKPYTKKYIYRTSLITDSAIIKTSLNLFFSIYTTVRPMKFLDSVEEAKQFVSTGYDAAPDLSGDSPS